MLTQFEAFETQLRDEEATQSQKAVKFNFAAEGGSGGTLMVVLTPTPQKLASLCFFCGGVSLHQGSVG